MSDAEWERTNDALITDLQAQLAAAEEARESAYAERTALIKEFSDFKNECRAERSAYHLKLNEAQEAREKAARVMSEYKLRFDSYYELGTELDFSLWLDTLEEASVIARSYEITCPHCDATHYSSSVPPHMGVYDCQDPTCGRRFSAGLVEHSYE